MDRAEVKRRLLAGLGTPGVEAAVVWSVLAECRSEASGSPHRVVDLVESVQPQDGHSRMRALLESGVDRSTPRSDLKEPSTTSPDDDPYLPPGVDLAKIMSRAAAGYKDAGVVINKPLGTQKPMVITESREELAKRVTDPVERAYLLLSGRV
ncbi:MAG TPA: hypothetical protein VL287_17745 [Gemmatimonadales bacterium]|jgi:hypothetical protein|nr:hypothetical protein [Gemmatimonadales bacterium]